MEGSDMNLSMVLVQRSIVGTQLHPGYGSDTEREENPLSRSTTHKQGLCSSSYPVTVPIYPFQ